MSSHPSLLINETTINKEKSARRAYLHVAMNKLSMPLSGQSLDRKEAEEFTYHPSKSKDTVEEYLMTRAHRSKECSRSLLSFSAAHSRKVLSDRNDLLRIYTQLSLWAEKCWLTKSSRDWARDREYARWKIWDKHGNNTPTHVVA